MWEYLIGKQFIKSSLPEKLLKEVPNDIYIQERPAMINNKCQRCGNSEWLGKIPCIRCGKTCVYCKKCIHLGRLQSCDQLVSFHSKQTTTFNYYLNKCFQLSLLQQKASDRVVDAWKNNYNLLVWAVCGAGKTEIIVDGIHHALKANQTVCIAIPRVDVVIELVTRFKLFFPHLKISALYGNSPDKKHLLGPLVIATTHQLMNFYHHFDWIIVDEVDAFPYSFDSSLQWAVKQAIKPQKSLVYLTATPKSSINLKNFSIEKIPIRYHGHLLDVPRFIWCGNWRKKVEKGNLPLVVRDWLKSTLPKHPVLLFAPHVEDLPLLQHALEDFSPIETVHAQDKNRKEKIMAMRNGEIRLLVTTTILERGVTFENVAVAIIGADEEIFDKSALIQISGRVGRKAQYPTGPITFFHYGKSIAMLEAKKEIQQMNRLARKYLEEAKYE